jgi:hypothetical protein
MDRLEDIPKKDLNIDRVKLIEFIKFIKVYFTFIFTLIFYFI